MKVIAVLAITAALAGCGGGAADLASRPGRPAGNPARLAAVASRVVAPRPTRARPPRPRALVTAETEDRVVLLDPATGRIERRARVAPGPEFAAADRRTAVVVSPSAGAVTLLALPSLRPIRVLRDFGAPHIAEISPDHRYAYVTDDARGELSVVQLADGRVVGRAPVGAGAHHIAVSPDGRRLWIALGEAARTIVIVDTANPAEPRTIGRFDPGFAAHDLRFAHDGRRVWITADDGPNVAVFDARTHRLLLRVPGGVPPQHVAFGDGRAFVTSGYGSRIEVVSGGNGRVIRSVAAPYGSFDLDASGGLVATSSLLRGTLTVYDDRLHRLRAVQIAPAARDVALSSSP